MTFGAFLFVVAISSITVIPVLGLAGWYAIPRLQRWYRAEFYPKEESK